MGNSGDLGRLAEYQLDITMSEGDPYKELAQRS